MKSLYLVLVLILFISCQQKDKILSVSEIKKYEVLERSFQEILDSANLKGSILVYDFKREIYKSNDFGWAKKSHLPASTFKIPNSIIGLEMGILKNDSTLFKWNGEQRRLDVWEQDLSLKDAFHYSCVPCYQELAREIGVKQMEKYIDEFSYGDIKVDSTNLDFFWLQGDSKINQNQQIDFLRRFYLSELPIKRKTDDIMKRMMIIKQNENYVLRGKTGWSITNDINNAWFVGYVETKENVYFFATNVEPMPKFDMNDFPEARKMVTYKALKEQGVL